LELTFCHYFIHRYDYYLALTYPWSYEDSLNLLEWAGRSLARSVYFHREVLAHTLENRRVDLVTISSRDKILEETEPGSFSTRAETHAQQFETTKRVIIISARVHPGEVPSSHVMNGIIKFLISGDPRAEILRKHFVFKIIPMINPDGVYRGYFRHDTNGVNLNRLYTNPVHSDSP
jgi:murein tripeptide amidase MpaA